MTLRKTCYTQEMGNKTKKSKATITTTKHHQQQQEQQNQQQNKQKCLCCPDSPSVCDSEPDILVTHLPIHPMLPGPKPLREGLSQTCRISTKKMVSEDSMTGYVAVASGRVRRTTHIPSCPCT